MVFILVLFLGMYSIVFGFPGTLVILFAILIFSGATGFTRIEPKHIAVIALVSVIAEAAGALVDVSNPRKPRYSPAVVVAAFAGSIAGAVILTPVLLGAGTFLGLFLGGFAGLLVMQKVEQKKLKSAFREPIRATLMRSVSVCGKGLVAMAIMAFVLVRVYS